MAAGQCTALCFLVECYLLPFLCFPISCERVNWADAVWITLAFSGVARGLKRENVSLKRREMRGWYWLFRQQLKRWAFIRNLPFWHISEEQGPELFGLSWEWHLSKRALENNKMNITKQNSFEYLSTDLRRVGK